MSSSWSTPTARGIALRRGFADDREDLLKPLAQPACSCAREEAQMRVSKNDDPKTNPNIL